MSQSDQEKNILIQLNGNPHETRAAATVASVIADRTPRPPFAVEVNKKLIRRPQYPTTSLQDGDTMEIVTLVGGG